MLDSLAAYSAPSIILLDQTSHYFGGYYHVKVLAYCDITLKRSYFDSDAEFCMALEKLGPNVRFERVLEKMAVPETEIESVRSQLLNDFDKTARAYLSTPGFAPSFVRSEYQKCINKSPRTRTSRA